MSTNQVFEQTESLQVNVLDINALKDVIKEEAAGYIADGVTDEVSLLEHIVDFVLNDDYVCNVLKLDLIYQTALSCNAALFEEHLLQQTLEIKPTTVYDTRESLERAGWLTIVQSILSELDLSQSDDALIKDRTTTDVLFRAQMDLEHQLAEKDFFIQSCTPEEKIKKLNGVMREVLQTGILIAVASEERVDITEIRNHVYSILRLNVADLEHAMKCKRDQYWRRQVSNGVYYLKKAGMISYDSEYKNYMITDEGLALVS